MKQQGTALRSYLLSSVTCEKCSRGCNIPLGEWKWQRELRGSAHSHLPEPPSVVSTELPGCFQQDSCSSDEARASETQQLQVPASIPLTPRWIPFLTHSLEHTVFTIYFKEEQLSAIHCSISGTVTSLKDKSKGRRTPLTSLAGNSCSSKEEVSIE